MLQPAVFTVDTVEAGSGEVLVYVEDPEGHTEEVSATHSQLAKLNCSHLNKNTQHLPVNCTCLFQAKVKPNKDKSRTYTVTYVPKVEGVHKVRGASV